MWHSTSNLAHRRQAKCPHSKATPQSWSRQTAQFEATATGSPASGGSGSTKGGARAEEPETAANAAVAPCNWKSRMREDAIDVAAKAVAASLWRRGRG